jgi:hypothetical protein
VERLLNVPERAAGWHFDLTVEVAGQGQQIAARL